MSTISAISSPIGAGGIGIVRVSGPEARQIADAVFVFAKNEKLMQVNNVCIGGQQNDSAGDSSNNGSLCGVSQEWTNAKMNYGTFYADGFSDKGYAVFFCANNAYTGEDTVEFFLHGGVKIVEGALQTILKHGAVLADKGEFTKRAFLAGKLGLADAEGVIDMINAESDAGVRAAYRLMTGEISRKIDAIMDRLITLISTLEATLDYPDEMEDEVLPTLDTEIDSISCDIGALVRSAEKGKMAKHGITVALAGETNAGKSSLLNAMLGKDRAIVTPLAGTTRDTITESIEWDGVRINLVDTAGIRESGDIVESAGIERAKEAMGNADVVLHIIDTSNKDRQDLIFASDQLVFNVLNKCDLTSFVCPRSANTFAVSANTGQGVEQLKGAIVNIFKSGTIDGGEMITSLRHLSALLRANDAINSAKISAKQTLDISLIDLREAYSALGEITGRTATEDIVSNIFEKFCVGK